MALSILFARCFVVIKRVFVFLFFMPGLLLSTIAGSQSLRSDDVPLDPSVLWLPLKYQKLQAKLYTAAEAALYQPRCIEVRSGTIDLRQSSPDVPVFRILCKEASGMTYTEVVTADGYESLTPKKNALLACYELLKRETKLMQELTWVPPKPLASYPSEKAARLAGAKGVSTIEEDADGNRHEHYLWDFDAESVNGEALHYRAECNAVNGANPSLEVKAR